MPAKYIRRIDKEKCYFHTLNRGISEKEVFKDEQDYGVFLGYLQDYLTPPSQLVNYKKAFVIKGRTFQGRPHQPKNYFDKVHLIAYNLMPDHFHLLLYQITKGSLANFMRSLSTRYSMYFNKRYQCTGPLFEGPYKSVYIDGISSLLHLTRYFHRGFKVNDIECSSYAEYLGKRETLWVKPDSVLSFFNNSENKTFRGIGGYKNFVEKYEPNQNDRDLLEGIILEKEYEHLEGSTPQPTRSNPYENTNPESYIKTKPRLFEYSIAIAIFILLFSLGYRNILLSSAKDTTSKDVVSVNSISSPSPTPAVAGTETEDQKPKIMLAVKAENETVPVNIRQEPTAESEKIGEARNRDILEFVSINSGWFGVKLEDGSTGYISYKYIEIIEEESSQ